MPLAPPAAAEKLTGPVPRLSRLQLSLVALLFFSALINYVDRQAIAVVSPALKQEFGLTNEQWGWIPGVFAIVYIATSALGGMWMDRVGIRRGLLLATVVWSFAAAGHALAGGFLGLCLWRVMLALGEGPGGAALLKGVRRVLPPRLQDTGTSLMGAGTLLGALVAPIIIAPIAASPVGWRGAFVITAAIGLLWVPFWMALAGRPGANLEARPEHAPAPGASASRLDYRSPAVWATAVCIFFSIPPTIFTLNFLPLFLEKTYQQTIADLAHLQWQPFLAMDLGQLLGGWMLFWLLGRGFTPYQARRLVMSIGFTAALGMLAMLWAPNLFWAMVWLNLSRFCFQFAYSGLLAYGVSCVREEQAGTMNGLMNATFGLCTFVFSPLIGRSVDVTGNYRLALGVVALSPAVALAGWLLLSALAEAQGRRGIRGSTA